jgi:hypothetical protein
MYTFQKFCYDAPLQPQALDSVKSIIQRNCQDGVFNNGITLSGEKLSYKKSFESHLKVFENSFNSRCRFSCVACAIHSKRQTRDHMDCASKVRVQR